MAALPLSELKDLSLDLIVRNRQPLEVEILEQEISIMLRTGCVRLLLFSRQLLDDALEDLVESGDLEIVSAGTFGIPVRPVVESVTDKQLALF